MSNNMTYNPYRAINDLQHQMQRLWKETMGAPAREEGWTPVVDIYEADEELAIMSELPGMSENDFRLSVENNVLTISGERKLTDGSKQLKPLRQERPQGTFQRSFSLPANFDLSKVNAHYAQGILKVTVPKKAEAKPRQIPVKVK